MGYRALSGLINSRIPLQNTKESWAQDLAAILLAINPAMGRQASQHTQAVDHLSSPVLRRHEYAFMFEVGDFVRVKYMAGGLEEFVDAEIDEISKNGKEFKVLFDEFDDEDSFSWEPARALQKRSKGLFEKSRRRASGSARTAFRNPTDTNFGAKTVEELTAPKQQKPAFPFALPSFGSNEPAEEEFFQEEPEPEKKPAFAFPSFNFGSNAPAEEPLEEEEEEPLEEEEETKPGFSFPSFPKF
jgi:hypothetical protein